MPGSLAAGHGMDVSRCELDVPAQAPPSVCNLRSTVPGAPDTSLLSACPWFYAMPIGHSTLRTSSLEEHSPCLSQPAGPELRYRVCRGGRGPPVLAVARRAARKEPPPRRRADQRAKSSRAPLLKRTCPSSSASSSRKTPARGPPECSRRRGRTAVDEGGDGGREG